MITQTRELIVTLPRPWPGKQAELILGPLAKRTVVRAGRRGGKTVAASIMAVNIFLAGRRVLYAAPTAEQIDTFWFEVKRALQQPIEARLFYKNETEHLIERPGTKNRIRAKTAWNADTLRGDYADFLILDEWQLMNEDAWERVGAPMLLDNDGDAMFIYTPPSLISRSVSKATDPRHAAKLFARAQADESGRWRTFAWTSHDNPNLSTEALMTIAQDMTQLAYRQEILAEDLTEVPGALWKMAHIDDNRAEKPPELFRIVIGVDPPGGLTECGIVVAGIGAGGHVYVLADPSLKASPNDWANAVLDGYERYGADRVVGESNYGGDMVENTLRQAAKARNFPVSYKHVSATRGKAVRAEPIVALYEQGKVHHVGAFPNLESEMLSWVPGLTSESPNRMDALVWACTELTRRVAWGAL